MKITIGTLLHNSAVTRAGTLDGFFNHLSEIARIANKARIDAEILALVDDRTTDDSAATAGAYCNPEFFKFTNFAEARNLQLAHAHGQWAFMAEPDMRYDEEYVEMIFNSLNRCNDIRVIEAWQCVHSPGDRFVNNLYYLLVRPTVKYVGHVFETVKVFPHEMALLDIKVGDHFTSKRSERMSKAEPLYRQELAELDACRDENPDELYWRAMRYNELGLMDCIPKEVMDQKIVTLLEQAIKTKPDFGPAYFELAKQHLYMGRKKEAKETAIKGHTMSGYERCLDFLAQVYPIRTS